MNLVSHWKLLLIFPLILCAGAFAQDADKQARAVVNDYYRHAQALDMAELEKIISPNATFKSTWEYGYGQPADTEEYGLAELKEALDPEMLKSSAQLVDYRQLAQSSEIVSATEKDSMIEVKAEETTVYQISYEGEPWKGEIKSTDTFQLKQTPDGYKIVDLVTIKQF